MKNDALTQRNAEAIDFENLAIPAEPLLGGDDGGNDEHECFDGIQNFARSFGSRFTSRGGCFSPPAVRPGFLVPAN